ncbi:MAG TPA: tetratricopeptide repeat protein, partial [Acidobacteriota bacterium]|nr:tetratricopeptide repeat protein [Acidobacteriota bacterium]
WLNYLFKLRRLQTSLYNRNDAFFTKKTKELDPAVDKEFTEIMSKGMRLCEEKLKKDKNDIHAMYYLGIAKGAYAGYETTVRRSFFSSLKNGSAAVDLHRNVLKRDPGFIDAYVSLGMYDYVTGSLPLAVKILAFLGGVRGSKKDGIAKLEKVVREGHYARVEAQVLLVLLYDREKRLGDSLNLLKELSVKFPRNSVFQLEKGRTLAQLRKTQESLSVFEGLLQDTAAMKYMPDLIHYQYAMALADSKQWQKAYYHFVVAASQRQAPESLVTMARLEAGKCLDAAGNHDLAKAEYQIVLRRDEAFDSHDKARQYIKKPFAPN